MSLGALQPARGRRFRKSQPWMICSSLAIALSQGRASASQRSPTQAFKVRTTTSCCGKIPPGLLHTISVLSSAANCFPIVDAASQRLRYELFAELALTEPARASDWASVIRTGGRCTVWGERTTDAAHPHLIVPRLVVGSLRCRLRAMASLGPRCPGQSGRCCNVRSGRH